jgi:spore maturation protein CgeB
MNIAFFGSSLLSAYWNGAATYYRGIIRALHARGHRITFYEPDAYERQSHRDLEPPEWASVVVYANSRDAALREVEHARRADLVIKASGVGVFDELLESAVLDLKSERRLVAFWDVDAPATLERLHANVHDAFAALVPAYDAIFTYGGGQPVIDHYHALGASRCVPIYNALDPGTHFPVPAVRRFASDLSFLGNRLPDREARVEEFFFTAANELPDRHFLMGGSGWEDKALPPNVQHIGHVYTADHNAFNCSARAVLNVSRSSMARYGFSPATRVFEAAGAGACLITDAWEGVEEFFEPEEEILVADNGWEVAQIVARLRADSAAEIGRTAYRRVLADHTYAQRAKEFEEALDLQTTV